MKKYIELLKKNDIVKSTLGIAIIALFVKVLGYGEKIVLAFYYGTGYQVDVYTTIITIVLSLFFFFREIVEPGFLNVFLDVRNKGDRTGAWNLFNKGMRLIFVITIIISLFTIFFPERIISVFAPGFKEDSWNLSVQLIRIAIPASIFLAVSTLTNITLNGLKIFILPASGELAFKGVIILCLVLLNPIIGIKSIAIGILVGAILRLLIHFTKLYKKLSFRAIPTNHNYNKRIWRLTWPLLLGVSFSQVTGIVDNIFASYMQEGVIAALSYSKKIIELPIVIYPYILSIVIFPFFTNLALEKKQTELSEMFINSIRWIIIVFLPLAIFIFIFANPIVEIIFQRGAFDKESTGLTATPLAIYSLGLVFFAIETILVIFYYSNGDTKTPIFVGICGVILNIVLTYIFLHYIGYKGIALAFVIQKTLKVLVLLILLKKKVLIDRWDTLNLFLKLSFAGIIFMGSVLLLKNYIYDYYATSLLLKLATIALIFITGIALYLAIIYYIYKPKLNIK